jgi:hypothetical protein
MARPSGEIARRARHVRELGAILTLATIMVAGAKAALAERRPANPLQGEARERVMHALAADEPGRRVAAIRAFPGDRWSQGDAFHGQESEIVRGQATMNNVALESVLDVLDADLHARRVPGRHAGVAPCKPRPQYD